MPPQLSSWSVTIWPCVTEIAWFWYLVTSCEIYLLESWQRLIGVVPGTNSAKKSKNSLFSTHRKGRPAEMVICARCEPKCCWSKSVHGWQSDWFRWDSDNWCEELCLLWRSHTQRHMCKKLWLSIASGESWGYKFAPMHASFLLPYTSQKLAIFLKENYSI